MSQKIAITFILSCVVIISSAQTKAITENGDEVLLYDDGTWKALDGAEISDEPIKTNPKEFTKNNRSGFLLKSNRFNVGFWLDTKKWKFEKANSNESAEYELKLKDGDLYGMIIAEQMEIPLETLKKIAVDNGRQVSPDLVIQNEEYRTVNGLKVLHLQMAGTMQGIKFFYYGYYFSNPNGTLQYVTWSAQNLLNTYQGEIENLLNGLVEL